MSQFTCHPEHQFITMIRDPYDAVVSGYFFIKYNELAAGHGPWDKENYDLIMNHELDYYLRYRQPNQLYSHYYDTSQDFFLIGHLSFPDATRELFGRHGLYFPFRAYNNNRQHETGTDYEGSRRRFRMANAVDYNIYNDMTRRFRTLCATNDILIT